MPQKVDIHKILGKKSFKYTTAGMVSQTVKCCFFRTLPKIKNEESTAEKSPLQKIAPEIKVACNSSTGQNNPFHAFM